MRTTMFAASMAVLATYTLSAIADPPPRLRVLGTYESGLFNVGSATVDVLDLRHPSVPTKVTSLDIVADLAPSSVGAANSVDTRFGILVVAVEADPKQDDGHYKLAANEGEPDTTYTIDPEGTVTIIDPLRLGRPGFARTVRFTDFNAGGPRHDELPPKVRIYGPNATVAQDLEPEYITTDGDTAWVTLQENNAIAVIDIRNVRVKKIFALGFKDHSRPRNKLDASDDDGAINIANWPVFGMYQPDAIETFEY